MIYQIVSQYVNGEEVLLNSKGCEDIEINDLNEVTILSDNNDLRMVGLNKRGLFKLTRNSYKQLKRELTKRGIIWRFNYSHRI